jgi:hypothetical protein
MTTDRSAEIVRRFHENGMKVLLETAANVRELLSLSREEVVGHIRFDRMECVRTTFVQRDYRHVEADVVLTAPLTGKKAADRIVIYILIEHQSEPDELMPLRLLEYVAAIYRAQLREWLAERGTASGFRFRPVLPVVFYTGTRTWERVGQLADLMERGELFARWLPSLEPLFLNVGALESLLGQEGGAFGQVLRLLLRRRAPLKVFRAAFRDAVEQLNLLPEQEQNRWRELLSYLRALVYNERPKAEHEGLNSILEASVQGEQRRQEVHEMVRTMADVLKEEGVLKGKREYLLRALRFRFGELPPKVLDAVETTTEEAQLDLWMERLETAKNLKQVGIKQPK